MENNNPEPFVHVDYNGHKNPITVVAVQKEDNVYIGVSRCGSDQKYNKALGIDIALHRAEIQPYTFGKFEESSLPSIASAICNHIKCERQPAIQNVRVTREESQKTTKNAKEELSV